MLCKGGGFERLARRRWDRFAGERSSPIPCRNYFAPNRRGDLWSPAATPIQNTNDYNPSVALRRQLPLLKGAFKFGLFVRTQKVFLIRRNKLCSPAFLCMASVPGYPRLIKASPSWRSNEAFIKLCITQKFFTRFFTKKRFKNFREDIFRLFRTTNRCFARKYRQEPCISRPFRRACGNLRLRSLACLYACTPAFCRREFLADL